MTERNPVTLADFLQRMPDQPRSPVVTVPNPQPTHEVGFFRRMPVGGTANLRSAEEQLKQEIRQMIGAAAETALGSLPVDASIEDIVPVMLTGIEESVTRLVVERDRTNARHEEARRQLEETVRERERIITELRRDRDNYLRQYVAASDAMTPALGSEPDDEVGHGLVSDVTVLVQRYTEAQRTNTELQARPEHPDDCEACEHGVCDYARDEAAREALAASHRAQPDVPADFGAHPADQPSTHHYRRPQHE